MSELADVIAGEAANALREIGALAGVPSTVDALLHLPDLVERVCGLAERAETVRVVTADRDALRAELDKRVPPHCQHAMDPGHDMLGHGVHPDRGGPSVLDAEIERLTARVLELEAPGECASLHKLRAERDRRIDPVEHARDVLAAFKNGGDEVRAAYAHWPMGHRERMLATLLARVGADVLAEVEDGWPSKAPRRACGIRNAR